MEPLPAPAIDRTGSTRGGMNYAHVIKKNRPRDGDGRRHRGCKRYVARGCSGATLAPWWRPLAWWRLGSRIRARPGPWRGAVLWRLLRLWSLCVRWRLLHAPALGREPLGPHGASLGSSLLLIATQEKSKRPGESPAICLFVVLFSKRRTARSADWWRSSSW